MTTEQSDEPRDSGRGGQQSSEGGWRTREKTRLDRFVRI